MKQVPGAVQHLRREVHGAQHRRRDNGERARVQVVEDGALPKTHAGAIRRTQAREGGRPLPTLATVPVLQADGESLRVILAGQVPVLRKILVGVVLTLRRMAGMCRYHLMPFGPFCALTSCVCILCTL